MKWQITQQQMDNLKAALAFWLTIDPKSVNLLNWREDPYEDEPPQRGAAACFGGWLPYVPHFKALGVCAEPVCGRPLLPYEDNAVSATLFGWRLFDPKGGVIVPGQPEEKGIRWDDERGKADDFGLTDHEVVIQRLNHAITHSEVV